MENRGSTESTIPFRSPSLQSVVISTSPRADHKHIKPQNDRAKKTRKENKRITPRRHFVNRKHFKKLFEKCFG